jgi:hypothetical protein
MHAALSLAVVTGSFQYEGGGAFHSNSDIFRLDKSLIEGSQLFRSRPALARPVQDRPGADRQTPRRWMAARRSPPC